MINVTALVNMDSGDTSSYIAHGHVDPVEFCAEIQKEFEHEFDPKDVQHVLARNVPLQKDTSEYCTYSVMIVSAPGRGVYKATYIDLL